MHAIAPNEPFAQIRTRRSYFADAWPSFHSLIKLIKLEAPDLVVCLGDMVDWYSQENRDFALTLLHELPCPWVAVPGNHDFQTYIEEHDGIRTLSALEGYPTSIKGWQESGIELHNRYMDLGETGLILLDSAVSGVSDSTRDWLNEIRGRHPRQLLFTHVPLDLPETREYIGSVDPKRDLTKYVQSRSPWVFQEGLQGAVSHIFTGHLHFTGDLQLPGTHMHMLEMAISDSRFPEKRAAVCLVDLGKDIVVRRKYITS